MHRKQQKAVPTEGQLSDKPNATADFSLAPLEANTVFAGIRANEDNGHFAGTYLLELVRAQNTFGRDSSNQHAPLIKKLGTYRLDLLGSL